MQKFFAGVDGILRGGRQHRPLDELLENVLSHPEEDIRKEAERRLKEADYVSLFQEIRRRMSPEEGECSEQHLQKMLCIVVRRALSSEKLSNRASEHSEAMRLLSDSKPEALGALLYLVPEAPVELVPEVRGEALQTIALLRRVPTVPFQPDFQGRCWKLVHDILESDANPAVRLQALEVVETLDQVHGYLDLISRRAVEDESDDVRQCACRMLNASVQDINDIFVHVKSYRSHPNRDFRQGVLELMERLENLPWPQYLIMEIAVKDEDGDVRECARRLLGQMKLQHFGREYLNHLANHGRHELRFSALKLLTTFRRSDWPQDMILTRAVEDEVDEVWQAAEDLLKELVQHEVDLESLHSKVQTNLTRSASQECLRTLQLLHRLPDLCTADHLETIKAMDITCNDQQLLQEAAKVLWKSQSVQNDLGHPDLAIRLRAVKFLCLLEPDDTAQQDECCKLLLRRAVKDDDKAVQTKAQQLLCSDDVDERQKQICQQEIRSRYVMEEDPNHRRRAVQLVWALRCDTKEQCLQLLLVALQDANPSVQSEAEACLRGASTTEQEECWRILDERGCLKNLANPQMSIRALRRLYSLSRCQDGEGPGMAKAQICCWQLVQAIVEDTAQEVKDEAQKLLYDAGPAWQATILDYVQQHYFHHQSDAVRSSALQLLGRLLATEFLNGCAPQLAKLVLEDKSPSVQQEALKLLLNVSPSEQQSCGKMIEENYLGNPELRTRGLELLCRLGRGSKEADLQLLEAAAMDEREGVREMARQQLRNRAAEETRKESKGDKKGHNEHEQEQEEEEEEVQEGTSELASRRMSREGHEGGQVELGRPRGTQETYRQEILQKYMRHEGEEVRGRAMQLLEDLCSGPKPQDLPHLMELALKDPSESLRQQASELLKKALPGQLDALCHLLLDLASQYVLDNENFENISGNIQGLLDCLGSEMLDHCWTRTQRRLAEGSWESLQALRLQEMCCRCKIMTLEGLNNCTEQILEAIFTVLLKRSQQRPTLQQSCEDVVKVLAGLISTFERRQAECHALLRSIENALFSARHCKDQPQFRDHLVGWNDANSGDTLLHCAARAGSLPVCKMLIEEVKAPIREPNKAGYEPGALPDCPKAVRDYLQRMLDFQATREGRGDASAEALGSELPVVHLAWHTRYLPDATVAGYKTGAKHSFLVAEVWDEASAFCTKYILEKARHPDQDATRSAGRARTALKGLCRFVCMKGTDSCPASSAGGDPGVFIAEWADNGGHCVKRSISLQDGRLRGGVTMRDLYKAMAILGPYKVGTANCHHGVQSAFNCACAEEGYQITDADLPNRLLAMVASWFPAVARRCCGSLTSQSQAGPVCVEWASWEAASQYAADFDALKVTPPSGFDAKYEPGEEKMRLALQAAHLSSEVYYDDPLQGPRDDSTAAAGGRGEELYQEIKLLHFAPKSAQRAVQWLLALSESALFAVFRGTDDLQDGVVDLGAVPSWDTESGLGVHSGMYSMLRQKRMVNITDEVIEQIGKHRREGECLVLCGHSLGGGYAQLVALQLLQDRQLENIQVQTFGAPHVVAPDAKDSKAAQLWERLSCCSTHWVYAWDPVPRLPLCSHWLTHVIPMLSIEKFGFRVSLDPKVLGKLKPEEHLRMLSQYDVAGKVVIVSKSSPEARCREPESQSTQKELLSQPPQKDIQTVRGLPAFHFMSNYLNIIEQLFETAATAEAARGRTSTGG